jgi:hypothetical protein
MNSKIIPVAVINPNAPAESLEAKQPNIDNGAEIYGKDGYFSAGAHAARVGQGLDRELADCRGQH